MDLPARRFEPDRRDPGDPLAAALDRCRAGRHRGLDRLWTLGDRDGHGADCRQRGDPSGSTPPPTAMHGTPASAARRATPSAVLPNAVCASIRPSPVTTRSLSASRASNSVASIRSSTPGRRANERNRPAIARRQNPTPPGRTGSGRIANAGAGRRPRARRRRTASRRSSSTTSAAVAPFCGPYTAAAPVGPSSGLATSQATARSTPRQPWIEAGEIGPRRIAIGVGAEPAPAGPAPPSVVALPPIPRTIEVTPASIAARIASPVPIGRGGHGIALARRDPRQARTPRPSRPRPGRRRLERSQRAWIASTERVVDGGRLPLPAAGRGDRLERALATVGERAEEGRVARAGPQPAICQRPRDLDRCQRALERIRREQDGPRADSRRRSPQVLPEVRRRQQAAVGIQRDSSGSGLPPASRASGRSASAGEPVTVSRNSSHRPSARARASAASISARPIPRRRASRWTSTLPISARCGAFGLGRPDQQRASRRSARRSRATKALVWPLATSRSAPPTSRRPRRPSPRPGS